MKPQAHAGMSLDDDRPPITINPVNPCPCTSRQPSANRGHFGAGKKVANSLSQCQAKRMDGLNKTRETVKKMCLGCGIEPFTY
mmetsp:Transcript_140885/g.245476  ORF Transcript_140885/g.245476 Transcript_140885/m.245476 type:complete len:83 (+) Transcript_140885:77-325(+)